MPDYEEFIFAVGLFLLLMAKSSDCEFLQKKIQNRRISK